MSKGQTITVHYTGMIWGNARCRLLLARKKPEKFPIGGGRVISGGDEGWSGAASARSCCW